MRNLASLTAALCLSSMVQAQPGPPQPLPAELLVDAPDAAKVAWLKDHVVADGPVMGGLTFAFPADFYRSRLILLGESHGVAAPQILDLELFKHLSQKIGLTDYLNRYLASGDEALLTRVFDHWTRSGAQWGNRASEAKLRAIRDFNQTLPAGRRIHIVGIDAVQDWPLVAEWIAGGDGAKAQAILAAQEGQRATAALAAMGDRTDAAALRAMLQDVAAGHDRETILFDSYARAVRSDGQGDHPGDRPAYGLWGMFHIMQAGVNGAQPFAARIAPADFAQIRTSVGQDFVPDQVGADAPRLVQYLGVFRNSDWAPPRD